MIMIITMFAMIIVADMNIIISSLFLFVDNYTLKRKPTEQVA